MNQQQQRKAALDQTKAEGGGFTFSGATQKGHYLVLNIRPRLCCCKNKKFLAHMGAS